jgi:hypothetical protein
MSDQQDKNVARGQYTSTGVAPSSAPGGQPGESVAKPTATASGGPFAPSVRNIVPSTPASPDTQLATAEVKAEEAENRRARLSSNLIEQKHKLIGDIGTIIAAVIVALYIIFGITIGTLLFTGRAFDEDLPVTAVVLVAMCGSIPTILSISLLVGLLSKEKESEKEDKSILDTSTIAKVCFEVAKYLKTPH